MPDDTSRGSYSLRAEFWDAFFGDRTEEVDCWADLASRYGDKILAPMCATGEVAFGLAQIGFRVTGVDRTPEMIASANDRAGLEDRIAFVQADIRTLALPDTRYDFAFFGTGDFHHFLETRDQLAVLARVAAHLRPGGGLALDLFSPPQDTRSASKSGGVFHPMRPPQDPGIEVWKTSETSYDPTAHTLAIAQKMFIRRPRCIPRMGLPLQAPTF